MQRKSKRSRACEFDQETKRAIYDREKGKCFFCTIGYQMPTDWRIYSFDMQIKDIMHFINRSAGGLGIEQNGVLGCRMHHHLLDNGSKGLREEMLDKMEEYLKSKYPGWKKEELYYKKYERL